MLITMLLCPDGKLLWISGNAPRKDLIGVKPWEQTHPEDRPSIQSAMGVAMLGDKSRCAGRSLDGQRSYRTLFEPLHQTVAIVGTARLLNPKLALLSNREREVLALSASLDISGIAESLSAQPSTIQTHRHRLAKKLGISGKAHSVAAYSAMNQWELSQEKLDPGESP